MVSDPLEIYADTYELLHEVFSKKASGAVTPKRSMIGKVVVMVPSFELWDRDDCPQAPNDTKGAAMMGWVAELKDDTPLDTLREMLPQTISVPLKVLQDLGLFDT